MCGIAGIRTYNPAVPITPEEIKVLLCSLEHRGNQATGIALLTDGRVHTIKDHTPAWSFTADKATDDFLEAHLNETTTMAILHTRWATVGNPENNDNNHPLFHGNTAIVHNGSIHNHTGLFVSEHMERGAETDSDVIRGLLDKYGFTERGLTALAQMTGSAAVAAFCEEEPDTLLLARSGSPLAYGVSNDKLWWASEMGAIQAAVKPWVTLHGLVARGSRNDVNYFTMPDHTAYLLNRDGIQLRRPFKVCVSYNRPDYSRAYTSYGAKMREFHDQSIRENRRLPAAATITAPVVVDPGKGFKFKIALCPKKECKAPLRQEKEKSWAGLICPKCKSPLRSLDTIKPEELNWEN